jgi:hypothetical protein
MVAINTAKLVSALRASWITSVTPNKLFMAQSALDPCAASECVCGVCESAGAQESRARVYFLIGIPRARPFNSIIQKFIINFARAADKIARASTATRSYPWTPTAIYNYYLFSWGLCFIYQLQCLFTVESYSSCKALVYYILKAHL